jgi:hypothetical protein
MDEVSQVQSVDLNASTLCQHAYIPGTSSLRIGGERLSHVEIVKSLEQHVEKPVPVSQDKPLVTDESK